MHKIFLIFICLLSFAAYTQTNLVQPTSISGTAAIYDLTSEPLDIIVDPIITPLTDPTTTTVSSYTDGSAFDNVYIWQLTSNTITMNFSSAVAITGVVIWNSFASSSYREGFLQPNHSVNRANFEFFRGGVSLGDENINVLYPYNDFGELYPFVREYTEVDEIVMTVISNHGGDQTAMQEIAFNSLLCDPLRVRASVEEICVGDTVSLTASSYNGGTITWADGVADGIPFRIDEAGTYTYTVTSDHDNDCFGEIEVIVHDLPTVEAIVSEDTICFGASVLFAGEGAELYTWDNDVSDRASYTPTETGLQTYTVIGIVGTGCADTASIDLYVAPIPVCDFEFIANGISSRDGSTGGCVDKVIQFNDLSTVEDPDNITEWNWTFGDGSSSSLQNPEHIYTAEGAYTVTLIVTSENGCSSTFTMTIIIIEGVHIEIDVVINNPTCFGFSDGSIVISIVGGGDEDEIYKITNEDGTILNIDNSNAANGLPAGIYFYAIGEESPCTDARFVVLNEPDQIDIDFTIFNPRCYSEESGWARINEVYNATGDYDLISYIWNPNPTENSGIGADSIWDLGAGEYTITINDENGCSEIFDFIIDQIDSLEFVEFDYEPAYCRQFGYQNGNGMVKASAKGGTAGYDYLWTNLENGETSNNSTWGGLNAGEYKMLITDANGCTLMRSITVDSLNPRANFEITSEQFTSNYKGNADLAAHFANLSENYANPFNPFADTTFFWNFDSPEGKWILNEDINERIDRIFEARGESYDVDVCLVAINKNGCSDTLCKKIVVYEPIEFNHVNIFSPNGDGANDEFTFEFKSKSISEFHCVIVDRWGGVKTELFDVTESWDGTDRSGSKCTDGVYFYIYEAITDDGSTLSGQGTVQIVATSGH